MRIKSIHIFVALVSQASIGWLSACTSTDHATACNNYLAKAETASVKHNYALVQQMLEKASQEADLGHDSIQQERVLEEQAINLLAQNNPVAAEASARKLIKIYDDSSSTSLSRAQRLDLAEERSRAKMVLSDSLIAQKRFEEAVTILGEARKELSEVLGSPGLASKVANRYEAALRASGKGAEGHSVDAETNAMEQIEADNARRQGSELLRDEQPEAAVAKLRKGQQDAVKSGSTESYVRATSKLAIAQYLLGHRKEAYDEAVKAVEKAKTRVSDEYKASAFAILALTAENSVEASKALKTAASLNAPSAIEELLAVSRNHFKRSPADKWREGELIWTLGRGVNGVQRRDALDVIYVTASENPGKLPAAINWYQELGKKASLTPEEKIICDEYIASMFSQSKHATESMQYSRLALNAREHLKESDIANKPDAALHLSNDYAALGQTEKAIETAQAGLAITDVSDYPHCTILLNLALARGYSKQKQYRKAMEYYDTTFSLCKTYKDRELPLVIAERAQANTHIKN